MIEVPDNYNNKNALVIPDSALDKTYEILNDTELRTEMVEKNFKIAAEHFGYGTLKKCLLELFDDYSYEILASRKKIQKSREEFSV